MAGGGVFFGLLSSCFGAGSKSESVRITGTESKVRRVHEKASVLSLRRRLRKGLKYWAMVSVALSRLSNVQSLKPFTAAAMWLFSEQRRLLLKAATDLRRTTKKSCFSHSRFELLEEDHI